ncbi:WD40 repeat-like protein [Irpex rosettiformis]|uniref:WD40 repeat-like protein n=1 Tax=Irpex rosettiformis TaxID=378272 RepID=A0ACB8TTY7_9APHY|nr:WD40 repeat-like protein [Irpex rosettiformis]
MEPPSPRTICVTPVRKRSWVPASVTNAYSTKKRRVTISSAELDGELDTASAASTSRRESFGDRFIAVRPEHSIPLNITPRSRRMANVFGLTEDRVLKYGEPGTSRAKGNPYDSLRTNLTPLLAQVAKTSAVSAASNLGGRKQFLLALDGPGIPSDPFAYPLTWSQRNVVAVACGKDVYYQNLDTRAIVHLCEVDKIAYGRPRSVQWSVISPTKLALGTTLGNVQLWDVNEKKVLHSWKDEDMDSVGGMDWNNELLAVGLDNGAVNLYDDRQSDSVNRLTLHQSKVHGVKWSTDRNYLATGDQTGVVYVWDVRAGKELSNSSRMGGRMHHNAPVKVSIALAWCPWQPDLLATGSTYPDGKIRVFSVKSSSPIPQPRHILPLHASITSLHWSPHCKEILSTHGHAWNPDSLTDPTNTRPIQVKSPLTHSITVHSYPSYRRTVSVAAHIGPVGHSCLSPDGTMLFTICPTEEAMKMWKVWSIPPKPAKKENMYDRFTIR